MDNKGLARIYFEAAANVTPDNLTRGNLARRADGTTCEVSNPRAVSFCMLGHIARVAKFDDFNCYLPLADLLTNGNVAALSQYTVFNDNAVKSNSPEIAAEIVKNKLEDLGNEAAEKAAQIESLTTEEVVLA